MPEGDEAANMSQKVMQKCVTVIEKWPGLQKWGLRLVPYALVSGGQKCTQFHTSTQMHFESSGPKKNAGPETRKCDNVAEKGPEPGIRWS